MYNYFYDPVADKYIAVRNLPESIPACLDDYAPAPERIAMRKVAQYFQCVYDASTKTYKLRKL